MKLNNFNKSFALILIVFSIFISNYYSKDLLSKELEVSQPNDIKKPKYRVGAGDELLIKIFKISQFDSTVSVLPDGSINLPRIGRVDVDGMTIDQLKIKLTNLYEKILKRPVIYVDLISARPIKISITGQVQKPGIYSLGINNNTNSLINTDGGERTLIQSRGWPTLTDAIQTAGGIKSEGDLKNILLIRKAEMKNENIIYNLDYWTPLKTGLNFINPLIYNGDSIRILKTELIEKEESKLIADSNFSPNFITVNVIGEVTSPGPKQVKSNSPVINGILSAGGFTNRSNKNMIKLFRLNDNGSISSYKFSVGNLKNIENLKSLNLKDGDTVYISKNLFTKGTDALTTVTKPITPIMNSVGLIRILSD